MEGKLSILNLRRHEKFIWTHNPDLNLDRHWIIPLQRRLEISRNFIFQDDIFIGLKRSQFSPSQNQPGKSKSTRLTIFTNCEKLFENHISLFS